MDSRGLVYRSNIPTRNLLASCLCLDPGPTPYFLCMHAHMHYSGSHKFSWVESFMTAKLLTMKIMNISTPQKLPAIQYDTITEATPQIIAAPGAQ